MYTVGHLIDALQEYDRDLPVFVSSDSEGNSISELSSVTDRYLVEKVPYGWDLEIISAEDREEGYQDAITLWPLN